MGAGAQRIDCLSWRPRLRIGHISRGRTSRGSGSSWQGPDWGAGLVSRGPGCSAAPGSPIRTAGPPQTLHRSAMPAPPPAFHTSRLPVLPPDRPARFIDGPMRRRGSCVGLSPPSASIGMSPSRTGGTTGRRGVRKAGGGQASRLRWNGSCGPAVRIGDRARRWQPGTSIRECPAPQSGPCHEDPDLPLPEDLTNHGAQTPGRGEQSSGPPALTLLVAPSRRACRS